MCKVLTKYQYKNINNILNRSSLLDIYIYIHFTTLVFNKKKQTKVQ